MSCLFKGQSMRNLTLTIFLSLALVSTLGIGACSWLIQGEAAPYVYDLPEYTMDITTDFTEQDNIVVESLQRELIRSERRYKASLEFIAQITQENQSLVDQVKQLQYSPKYRQFNSVTEAKNYLSQVDIEDMLRNFHDSFNEMPSFNLDKCVGVSYALARQGQMDGYLIVVTHNNNNSHWLNQTIIGEMIYDIDFTIRGWELTYVTWVE